MGLTRQLAAEKRLVEELRGSALMSAAAMEVAETNQHPVLLPLKMAAVPQQGLAAPPILTAPIRQLPVSSIPGQTPSVLSPLVSPQLAMPPNTFTKIEAEAPSMPMKEQHVDGNASDMSDDTAEVDSNSEGMAPEAEPAAKRRRVEDEADAIQTQLPVHMPVNIPVGIPAV